MSTDNKTEIIEKQKMEENVIHNIKILVENDVQQKPQEKNGSLFVFNYPKNVPKKAKLIFSDLQKFQI